MSTEAGDPAPATIMVVDDIEEKRYVTAHVLKRAGYTVREADGGARALEMIDEAVDAVVLDVFMPDIDGFEVARRLRSDPRTSSIPIMMLTATYRETEAKVRGLGVADAFILEPVEPAELVAIVESALRKRRSDTLAAERKKMDAVGRLAGGLAHDFNNLLTVILGYTQVSLDKLDADHEIAGNLEEIRKAGEECARLTRQLLAFSRRQLTWPTDVDVNKALTDFLPAVRRVMGAQVEVRTELAGDLGTVSVDPAQLEQAVLMVALNAREAMPTGGKLTLATAAVDLDAAACRAIPDAKPGTYTRLSIEDSGVGMDAATRARAFEPFFTTKEMGRGAGLGLAAVLGIVQQNNGAIALKSEPGKGTRVEIYLPRRAPASGVAPDPVPLRAVLTEAATVLVVEDETMLRSFARSVLAAKGYHVLTATDGVEALETLRANPGRVDLVLSDVLMPRMNGIQLATEIEKVAPGVQVLMMSGLPSTGEPVSHKALGDRPLLLKPFTHRQLVEYVGKFLPPRKSV